jgi:outer membrane protein assembly factor BamA
MMLLSCSSTRFVPEGDFLYKGAKLNIDSGTLAKEAKADLEKIVRPKPNSSILGVPYKLWMLNVFPNAKKKEKGFLHGLISGITEEPVLLSSVRAKAIKKSLENHLFDQGYFKASVQDETIKKGKESELHYHIRTSTRYQVRNIFYPQDSSELSGIIRQLSTNSLVAKGDFLVLETLEKERERIDAALKNKGYFYFSPNYILYKVDSLHQGKADIYFTLKEGISSRALNTWNIGIIDIYGNYNIARDSARRKQEKKREKEFTIIDSKERYRKSVYEDALVMEEGQLYEKNMHALSIERLMNLNTFRFARFVFLPDTLASQRTLNTRVYLTPLKKNTLRVEASANTKTGNFVGSELSVNWRNTNVFRGAEILDFKVSAGFDFQLGGRNVKTDNAYSLQGELNLYFPRIIPRLKVRTGVNPFLPRTGINLSGEYLRRPDLYTQRAIQIGYDYTWKPSKKVEHMVKPLRIKSIVPTDITPKFDSTLAEDIALRASFEKQLVVGSQYQYHYNNTFQDKRFTKSLHLNFGSSGNLVNLFSKPAVDTPGAVKLFGVPVSQFLKIEADARGYLRFNQQLIWANRIIASLAYAYGNSRIAPYAEQFFSGGSSSIRAFRIRTLGPGSYRTNEENYEANESGDIKFELNTEFRYSLGKYLRLAAFADAGNIWYRREPPDKPGSGLKKGDLFGEMAVGAGLGLRLDFSIMLLRFDLATPLRKPWYPEDQRWVFNEFDPGNKDWRKENLILNIGIGYPF